MGCDGAGEGMQLIIVSPFKPMQGCEAARRDGASEESPCMVDEVVTSSREVKTKDCLYSFSIFVGYFSHYASKWIRQLWLYSLRLSTRKRW